MNEFSHFQTEEPRAYNENYFRLKADEAKTLRKLSFFAGSAVLLYVFIQQVIVLGLELSGLLELYISNPYFSSGVDIFLTLLGVLLPFSLIGRKMEKISGVREPVMTDATKNPMLFIFGTLACTGCVMLANIFSSYISYFISLIGYELETPDLNMPEGFSGFLISILKISILTAVVEEVSLRGHIMGNLRKYGDVFAIVMASAVFALMHGTLVQVPFAMLSGIALGFFAVKTDSIWPAVAAHAINNGLSVGASYLMESIGEETGMLLYTYAIYVLIFVGLVSCFLFALSTKDRPLKKSQSVLRPIEKVWNFLLSPTTILAIVLMISITAKSVS